MGAQRDRHRREKWSTGGGWGTTVTDLDVDALLGALLLAEHAALAVAEEAPGAGRRRGDAEARGEGAQRGPHRHLVLSRRDVICLQWGWGALGSWKGAWTRLDSNGRGGGSSVLLARVWERSMCARKVLEMK